MTQLETLLERAADDRPLPFDSGDVRRRVGRRRRARRTVLGLAVVLVGVAGVVVVQQRDDTRTTLGGLAPAELEVVGRWRGLEVDGMTWQDRVDEQLDELQANIARQQEAVDQAEGADKEIQSQVLLQLLQERVQLQTHDGWDGAFLELRPDGTLGGDDGCNPLAGHWRLDGDRLLADLVGGSSMCSFGPNLEASRSVLQRVLMDGPTVSTAGGSLTLTAASGAVRFLERDATIETELQVPVDGGIVKVTFHTRRSLPLDGVQDVATWTGVTSADAPQPVWVGVSLGDCGGAERSAELQPHADATSPEAITLLPTAACRGPQELVLRATVGDRTEETRAPITVG